MLKSNVFLIWVWIIFFILQSLSFIAVPSLVQSSIIGNVSTFLQFKGIAVFSLSFFIAYFSAYKANISDKQLVIIGLLFFALSTIRFFYDQSQLLIYFGREGITNNAAYMVISALTFLPIIFNKYKMLGIFILFLSIFLIINGLKRGAIVCLAALIIFSLWYYKKYIKWGFKSYIFTFLFILGCTVYSVDIYKSNKFIQRRIEKSIEGDSSGRMEVYAEFWEYWKGDSNLTFFLGNGMSRTVSINGNYAHNDWLELLINNGLCGALVYLLFFVSLLRFINRMTLPLHLKCAAYFCLIIWILKTLVSMGYTDLFNAMFMILLGLLVGKQQRVNIYGEEKNPLFD